MKAHTIVALLSGPDQPGLVSRVSSWIFLRGSNIHHADQHKDQVANIFFQRVEWAPSGQIQEEADSFKRFAEEELGMEVQVALSTDRPKVALFVSKIDHCFHDTILRFRAGEMTGELACIVSNHTALEDEAKTYGIPFYHVPVTKETKADAEAKQLEIVHQYGCSLVVMARYMQVLSDTFLERVDCPVINIHHSFLPAFAGGKPYHQAHSRGVKLIGATAHYATADLDEGPIIHQDVTRINHRNAVADLIRKGKDLEKSVFAHAIRLHLDNRILVYNNKTVVFD
ncbi:formyltetrahydrofolate deformylase [Coraliomargarita akajimensis]|uniref:Formyltetrahydrofolate deformylase n=1 Tax=Coraliomargarita akajimensis (strain DSM 45221 / IAM 15411 / JCM 23193 / KCTC 12865 / 04OKA010-24) TaxID=583355 RepID=D5EP11_CORAD|nr:formyltetrahydrofolate deformylase [Coraliomargarita akajimensis]ADE55521.1 formyltetrahydrofolate deformylase [Coraliomargarita akajimensis DSM 45221]